MPCLGLRLAVSGSPATFLALPRASVCLAPAYSGCALGVILTPIHNNRLSCCGGGVQPTGLEPVPCQFLENRLEHPRIEWDFDALGLHGPIDRVKSVASMRTGTILTPGAGGAGGGAGTATLPPLAINASISLSGTTRGFRVTAMVTPFLVSVVVSS